MSFTDPDLPEDSRWLGGINTEADTVTDAITWTHIAGINPGGHIQILGYRAEWVDPEYVDRLVTDREEWGHQPFPRGAVPLPKPLPAELIGEDPLLLAGFLTPEPRQG
jgi:hypothetical protein